MKTIHKYMFLALSIAVVLNACKKDSEEDPIIPPPPTNEEELITTLELHFHSIGGTEHKHFTFTDLDGDGGAAPVVHADTLSNDTVYNVGIEVLNESAAPTLDITQEILEEANIHQFFFQVNAANATVAYADLDGNGMPIGLNTTWSIGAPSVGSVTVVLIHQPDKTAAGVSGGDVTNAGGETDIEVQFPMVVE